MGRTDSGTLQERFSRALEAILARVFVSEDGRPPAIAMALSGGLDSMVLLHLLSGHAKQHGVAIHAFHVHHGLSPQANAWLEHCRDAAAASGAAFQARHVTIAEQDRRGVEAAARMERYAALGEMCQEAGVALLLTGHHRDDQAETVLLQMMRGAGLAGLAGMPVLHPVHPLLGGRVVLGRPLLDIDRGCLEREAAAAGLKYVTDESNSDPRYRRNALRHQVMPLLGAASPGCAAAIVRTASHAQEAMGLLDDLADQDLAACHARETIEVLDVPRMQALPGARVRNMVRRWLRLAGLKPPSTAAIAVLCDQMLHAAADGQPVFEMGSMQVRRFRGQILLEKRKPAVPDAVSFRWAGEAMINCQEWHGRLVFHHASTGVPGSLLRESVLRLRERRSSERLQPQANRPSKTLKALYQEAGIPAWRRTHLPVLLAGDALVFAAGIGINMRYAGAEQGILIEWLPDPAPNA